MYGCFQPRELRFIDLIMYAGMGHRYCTHVGLRGHVQYAQKTFGYIYSTNVVEGGSRIAGNDRAAVCQGIWR